MPKRGKGGRFVKGAKRAARKAGKAARRYGARAAGYVRRHRGTSLGLVGKTGVAIAAGAPLVASGLDAAQGAVGEMRFGHLGLMSTANFGFWRFLNGLSSGFGMGDLITTLKVYRTDGTSYMTGASIASDLPDGAWFKTSVIGGTLIAWDILISWASRKLARVNTGVRFLGTKLTGGK